MQKLRIYIPVLVTFLSLAAAMTATAADELKIVYNVGVAPLKFEDAASQPAGLFPDIWRLWARKTGKKVQFVKVDSFKESLQLLKDGKVDLHAGLFKTPEREGFLDYSEQLLALDYYIFTHPSIHPIKKLEKTAGLFIGIQKGGYTEQFVRSKVPASRIVLYDRFQDLFRAALEGEIKVFVATELSLLYYLKENLLINFFEYGQYRPLFSQVYYTATRKGDPLLIQQVNDGLKAIGSQERKQLEDKWIVKDFREIPREPAAALPEKETRVALSAQEQAFLKAHPVIRVHNEKDWPPFNYFEHGSPRGLSIDYMNLVAEQLGIKVEYVTGPSWNEFLGMVKRKELDVMLNIVKTEDRMKYLLYTEPYIKNPNVIVSAQESPYETIQALFGKTVAFPKGFFYEEVLTKSFPQIKRLPVEDTLASLKAVTFGRADAALGEAAVLRTLINKNLLTGLRISGEVNIGNPDLTNLRLGARNDWPLLHSALMKAMAAITPQEMNQIWQKWIGVDVPTTSQETAVPIAYGRLIAYGIAVFLILSLLAWILIKTIKKENIAVSFGSRWFRGLVLAGLSFFVMIVCLLGWFTLERNRENLLAGVAENLTEVLKIADDRLHLWVEQRTSFLKLLGHDPELVTLTKRLLAVTPERESLLASDALRDTRAFFKNNKDIFSNIGFFIINTDDISIGSMRDSNIGTRNLISLQSPDLLRRAFEGEVLFVPPIESDVPLGNGPKADGARKPFTKFFMGPIRDTNGQIIAVMTLRVDPSEDFSRVLTSFEMRKTFETYAFSEHGELLSESRFDEQLRRIGLIAEGQQSASNIAIRDPGVNLVKGLHPKIERSQQPLTRMASRAIQLKLNMEKAGQTYGHSKIEIDTKGYRDYRGVPVFGAWIWDADLGLGLATEIDVKEAMSDYYQIRRTVFGVLGFTLFLSVGAVLLVLILGERTSQALRKSQDELELRVQERTAELRKLSQATENSPASVVISDKNGTIEYVNPTFCEVTGYSAEEAIGQNPKILKSGNLPESFYKELWDTLLSGKVWRGEFINKRKNGEEFWESASISPIMDEEGEITHFVAVKQDITENKVAEEAIRASEEKSRLLLQSVGEGVFGVDLDGKVAFINPAANRMLGYGLEELIGQDVHEKIHHSRADGSAYPKSECPMYLTHVDGTDHHIANEVLWRKDGSSFPVEYTSMPIKKNEQVVGAVVTFMDITERKRAEEVLKESEEALREQAIQLRTIFQKSPIGILHIGKDGIVLDCNTRHAELMGSTREKIIGMNLRQEIRNDEVRVAVFGALDGVQKEFEGEYTSVSGGKTVVVRSLFNPTEPGTSPTEVINTTEDITERKEMEAQIIRAKQAAEDATQAKSDFLANMSHEIRTPMNAVIGMAHLALKTELTAKQQDYLNKIQSSANSLLGIINDILDFSKIEAGKLDMEAVEFDLSETMDNVANVISVKAQEKENLEVLFYLDSRVPNFLVGDPLRLNQILVNLGNNAVKFTEHGEIVLTTKMIETSDDKVTLQFSMRDTGIGMTAEQQADLFQAFSQADTSTTRKYGGTGLGLTISKRLVNMMDGEIRVESESGQGTTFSFTADFGLGKEMVKKRFVPSPDLRGLKVLVVDDNATSRQIFQDILESFSFKVTLAASGEEALEEIERADRDKPFELVIMDWKMPGMDGIEASERIKTNRALSKIPAIVMVTAYGREEIMQQADEIGLEGFLLKPVNSSVLFDAIMQALGKEVQDVSRVGRKKERRPDDLKAIQGARVLLVEDNEINQQVAKEILEGAGLVVTIANDGREGVDLVQSSEFEAVLMDIQMPVMDGYTATRKIREWELKAQSSKLKAEATDLAAPRDQQPAASGQKPIPIIAMTAHAMAGDEDKSLKAGMNGHVTKPIDPDQLFATLQKWIQPDKERIHTEQPKVSTEAITTGISEPDGEEFPKSLPGFDLKDGLKRLQGNEKLYRKLLLDFGTKYTDAAAEIRQALDAGDFEQAHSLVHNLKGLAGNLAASDLQAAAVEMEKRVKGDPKKKRFKEKLNQTFNELEKTINEAIEAVKTLGSPALEKPTEPSSETLAEIPPELAREAAGRIRDAAEMGDVTRIKSIIEELNSKCDAFAPFGDRFVQLAEDFDFDAILKLVSELDN